MATMASLPRKILNSYLCWSGHCRAEQGPGCQEAHDSSLWAMPPHVHQGQGVLVPPLASLLSSNLSLLQMSLIGLMPVSEVGNSTLVSILLYKSQREKLHTQKEAFFGWWPQSMTYPLQSENVWYRAHNENLKYVFTVVTMRYYEKK